MSDNPSDGFDRRKLLAAMGAAPFVGAASRAFAQEAHGTPLAGNFALPDPMESRMRWAIVGLGSFAVGQVIPGFADARKSRITAFVSGSPEKQADLGSRYGVDRFYNYENYDQIAADPEIDCVYIALPVGLHAEYTIRALKAGKHVLCEKPMASTSQECEAMIAAARAANRNLGVAYRVQFEPTNIVCKRMIDNGEIGEMRLVTADHGFNASLDYPPHIWRLQEKLGGGGSMYDIGVYGINTSLMMLGQDPVSVSAVYSYPRDDPRFREVEGGMEYRLRMPNDISVQGSSSYCYDPYVSRQGYYGSKASLFMNPATTYDNNMLSMEGGGPTRQLGSFGSSRQFAAQVDGFSEAARNNTPHRTPGEMGLRDIRIIEAAYESADNGGKVVEL